MSTLSLLQDDSEVASPKSEPLLDNSGHRHLRATAWNPVSFAEYPHGSGPIVELKHTGSHGSERIGNLPRDGDLFARKSGRILVNLGDALMLRATGQQYAR